MRTAIIPAFAGLFVVALLVESGRRSSRLRRILLRNAVAVVGSAVAAIGLALLVVAPISKYFSDAGRLWCGTYVIRSEN
jgi:hypothetical protein